MTMKKRFSVLVAVLVLMSALVASADSPALEPGRVINQGEFAVLFARAIAMKEPAEGFTADSAVAWLNGLQSPVTPADGWKTSSPLTERVMVDLVKHVGIIISPSNPDALVTVAKANLVFRRYDRQFKHYILYNLNVDNSTNATVLDEGDVTGVTPVSGFRP